MFIHNDGDMIVGRQRTAQGRKAKRRLERIADRLDGVVQRRWRIGPFQRYEPVGVHFHDAALPAVGQRDLHQPLNRGHAYLRDCG